MPALTNEPQLLHWSRGTRGMMNSLGRSNSASTAAGAQPIFLFPSPLRLCWIPLLRFSIVDRGRRRGRGRRFSQRLLSFTPSGADVFHQRIKLFLKGVASCLPAVALDTHGGWSRKVADELTFQSKDIGLL